MAIKNLQKVLGLISGLFVSWSTFTKMPKVVVCYWVSLIHHTACMYRFWRVQWTKYSLFCSSSPPRSELPLDLVDLPADIAAIEKSIGTQFIANSRLALTTSRQTHDPRPRRRRRRRCFLFKRRAPQLQPRGRQSGKGVGRAAERADNMANAVGRKRARRRECNLNIWRFRG